jgi:hypothetical protein
MLLMTDNVTVKFANQKWQFEVNWQLIYYNVRSVIEDSRVMLQLVASLTIITFL